MSPLSMMAKSARSEGITLVAIFVLAAATALAASCTGQIQTSEDSPENTAGATGGGSGSAMGAGGSGSATSGGGGGSVTPGAALNCNSINPGRVTIHRLNDLEYDNTVRDLLGDTTQPALGFPPDTGGANFDNNADVLSTSPLLFSDLETAADTLSNKAVAAGSASLANIVTCDPTKVGATACATTIMTAFARKAWRRPATSDELKRLISFVSLAQTNGDGFNQGIALGIKYALLSPNFMFRSEMDPDPTATAPRPLNSYEIASRLSYFLWSSMPDATLSAAADAGQLQDPTSLQQQATRMLADPKAQELVTNLAGEWFGVYKLASVSPLTTSFPNWDPTVIPAMTQETTLFLNDFFLGTESLPDAIDAPWTYANAQLAKYYGLPAVTGTAFQKVSLTGTKRAGLLTQGSILITNSFPTRTSPVRRGNWVLSNILCTPPPSPPDNVPPLSATVVPPGSTQRVQLQAHISTPACAGCHAVMDPIGFGLEHFDGIGQWRDMDGTAAVDATGTLPGGQSFDGTLQLEAALKTQTTNISACATQKIFSYSLGRDPATSDQCQLNQLITSFTGANYNLRSLIMQMIASDTFRLRQPVAPGGI